MLGSCMKDWISNEIRCTDIVTPQLRRMGLMETKITQQKLELKQFSSGISNSLVFSLYARSGHSRLLLKAPRNQVVTKINTKATSGPPIIWTFSLIGIGKAPRRVDAEPFSKRPWEIVCLRYLRILFTACHWVVVGLCINWQTWLIANDKSGRVFERYCREPIVLWNRVRSGKIAPSNAESSLACNIFVWLRRSMM